MMSSIGPVSWLPISSYYTVKNKDQRSACLPVLWILSGFTADPDPIFWWLKILKSPIFKIKNCNLFVPRLLWRTSELQEKPSALKKRTSSTSNLKFLNFFLFLWIIFALLYPDPHSGSSRSKSVRIRIQPTKINADSDPADKNQCGSGSSRPKSMRIRIQPAKSMWIRIHNIVANYTFECQPLPW